MISKKELPDCPVATAVFLIGNKWKLLILRELIYNGVTRFNRLKKSIDGISQKVLTQNLRELESDYLIKREIFAEVPPRVEYSLTDTGASLIPLMNDLAEWGEKYKNFIGTIK